jgi:signal transduction histidine kinase
LILRSDVRHLAPVGARTNHPEMRWGVSNAESGEGLREVVDRLQGEVTELRRSRKRIAEAAHADRRAIERALHDGVQQHLIALAVDLRRLGPLMDGDPPAAKTLLDEMAANVRQAVDETMELALNVYPPLLEGRGFAAALRSAAESAGVTALVDVPAGARYPPEIAAAVYWSWVEVLSSASRGSQATVRMRDEDGVLTFEVAVTEHHPEGWLDRLRDRIEALDGGVSVDEREAGGSRVHGWLPLSGRP